MSFFSRSVAWTAVALGTAAAPSASGQAPGLEATLDCESRRGPGRVRCELEVRAPAGRLLEWADALVLETPAFARALRSRVGMREHDAGQSPVRLALALVLEGPGRGLLRVRARAVLCEASGAARCSPATRDVQLDLVAEP